MICHYCANVTAYDEMYSEFMCKTCKADRRNLPKGTFPKPLIPKYHVNAMKLPKKNGVKGLICEQFIYYKRSIFEIANIYNVPQGFVSDVISQYIGNGTPINLTFKPIE